MITDAFEYLKQTQRFLREAKQDFENPEDLLVYINRARREVAGRTQCIRRLTRISGQVVSVSLTAGGSGYVAPIAIITTPDWPSGMLPNPNGRQATAAVQFINGVVTAVTINDGGDGYFQPQITILDSNGPGTGATATPVLSPINTLNQGQEVYNFSDIYVGNWPGVDVVHAVKSASVIYSQYRYTPAYYSFSTYQALVRTYSSATYQYTPGICAQYGQGAGGSFYFYPTPNQQLQAEYDCFCLPSSMQLDNSIPEAIPQPWTDAVPYFAAHLAMIELGNLNAAKFFEQLFDKMTLGYSTQARPGRTTNQYGRY